MAKEKEVEEANEEDDDPESLFTPSESSIWSEVVEDMPLPPIPLEESDTIGMTIPLSGLATIGDGIYVQPSTLAGTGVGLFVTRIFPAEAMITGYQGKFISRKEALMLRQTGRHRHVIRCGNFTFHSKWERSATRDGWICLQPQGWRSSHCEIISF